MDENGAMLLQKSSEMAKGDEVVRKFLFETPLPPDLEKLLPDEFRVFCLMLNALKQWVAAEQSATDRYLLGGTARNSLRKITDQCLVTGEKIGPEGELHHPVRDGRPPILLSKAGHSLIEGQIAGNKVEQEADPVSEAIKNLRDQGNHSWIQLREGCLDLLGLTVQVSSPRRRNASRSFAKKVHQELDLSNQQILDWLEDDPSSVS
jgi:hypothetical protein